jgi:hypothetical protein
MPYTTDKRTEACTVCGWEANILYREFGRGEIVDCFRCGDYQVSHITADDLNLPFKDEKMRALASYTVRHMHPPQRPVLTREFFDQLGSRNLPTPSEASDNLIRWLADQAQERPGKVVRIAYDSSFLLGSIGVIDQDEASWAARSLIARGLLEGGMGGTSFTGFLTAAGWQRFEELQQARIASSFAFFARRFDNPELDRIFETCLSPAVRQTGYELRTVPQRAGLIDAVVEDEIRRCRFLIADLSDENAGAYWEAGFAEGLGKPVIYVCRAKVADVEFKTHFDTDHRQTVRWGAPYSLAETAQHLKAVIRNTLPGDAKQDD